MATKNIFNKLILLVIMLCLFIVIGCKNNSTDPGGNGGDGGTNPNPKSFLELKDQYYYTENVDNIISDSGNELSTNSNDPNVKDVEGDVHFYMKDNKIHMYRNGDTSFNIYMKVIEQVDYNGVKYQHDTMEEKQISVPTGSSETHATFDFKQECDIYPDNCKVTLYLIFPDKSNFYYSYK